MTNDDLIDNVTLALVKAMSKYALDETPLRSEERETYSRAIDEMVVDDEARKQKEWKLSKRWVIEVIQAIGDNVQDETARVVIKKILVA